MNSTATTLSANHLVGYIYIISRLKVCTLASYRCYSTSKFDSQSSDLPPVPATLLSGGLLRTFGGTFGATFGDEERGGILTINNLNNKDYIKYFRILLKDKGGIYSFINIVNGNQYIGSAKDLYLRLNKHLENKRSNLALQKAFVKYGLDQFKFCTT